MEPRLSSAIKILREVDVEEVERYYLQSELLKLAIKLGWDSGSGSVDQLHRGELLPLCLHQSLLNQDYTGEFLGRSDFEWFEGVCPIAAVTIVDMDQRVDTTNRSVQRNLSAEEFAREVGRWLTEHQPERRPLVLEHVILRQRGEEILLLDGGHRFMRQVAEGSNEVKCFYGRPTGKPTKLTVTGPEIRRLRDLWRTAPESVREAIFLTTQHLVNISRNGAVAVEIFWIMYGREPEVRDAGRHLIGRDPNGPDRIYNWESGRFE